MQNKDLVTPLKRNFNKKWWLVNEELLHTLKLVLSAILFSEYLGIKIKIGINNIYYSMVLIQIYFVQLIYCFYDNDDELNDDKYF